MSKFRECNLKGVCEPRQVHHTMPGLCRLYSTTDHSTTTLGKRECGGTKGKNTSSRVTTDTSTTENRAVLELNKNNGKNKVGPMVGGLTFEFEMDLFWDDNLAFEETLTC